MRILFIHEVDYLKKFVFEMHEFPEYLAVKGHEIVFMDFPEDEGASILHFRLKDLEIRGRALPEAKLRLLRLPRLLSSPFDRLALAFLFPIYLLHAIRRVKPEVVVLYGVPTNGWQTVLLCRLLRIPVIYRAIDVSHLIRDTSFKTLVKKAERCVARNASVVLANSAAMAKHIDGLGANAARVSVLFPGFLESESPREFSSPETETKIILFMGTLFDFCGVEEMIAWIAEHGEDSKRAEIWVMGDGPARLRIVCKAREVGMESNLRMLGVVPFEELYRRMKAATVAVLPFQDIYVTNTALPGKVPQYIWAGLPVVSTHLAGLKSLLEEGVGVRYAAPGHDFVNCLDDLLKNSEYRSILVERGQEALRLRCDWPTIVRDLEEILEASLIGNESR